MCKFHNSLLSNNYEIDPQNIIIKNKILMIAESNIFRTLREGGGNSLYKRYISISNRTLLDDDRVCSRSGPENRHVRTVESIFS